LKRFYTVIFSALFVTTYSQDSIGFSFTNQISSAQIEQYARVISSDDLEGRETGERGQKMAARYIVEHLKSCGIEGAGDSLGYYQRFKLYGLPLGDTKMYIDGKTYSDQVDYYSFTALSDTVLTQSEIVFLGYGISRLGYDNYAGLTVKGKIGVIYRGEPEGKQTEWSTDFSKKSTLAKSKGMVGLIVVDKEFESKLPRAKFYQKKNKLKFEKPGEEGFSIIHIGPKALNKIFNGKSLKEINQGIFEGQANWNLQQKPMCEIHFNAQVREVIAENILGVIPGNRNPDEYVFISAHYDHLGIREEGIYNGADDNGSGTSAVMELARVMKLASDEQKGVGRSVVFLFVSGEEKGLLGSTYYVENPIIPLSNIIADLNIDMIGRCDTIHDIEYSNYLYVIGSDKLSTDLHQISEAVNDDWIGFDFDYRYNAPDDPFRLYYRSDHYNFAKYGIPVIFYFRGLHEDYHKTTDTFDKLDIETITKVSKLVFMTAREIGNRSDRLMVDVKED
jgi:hypothetical protein